MTKIQLKKIIELKKEGWATEPSKAYGGNIVLTNGANIAILKPDGSVKYNYKKKRVD